MWTDLPLVTARAENIMKTATATKFIFTLKQLIFIPETMKKLEQNY